MASHPASSMRQDSAVNSLTRCSWARTPLGIAYHDAEWGVPVHDDTTLFEFLTLEGAQAGLSWETILKKREAYREAFLNFDPARVARFTPVRIERLLQNAGIVRNRLKIESTVAQRARVPRRSEGVRQLRCLRLGLRRTELRWTTAGSSLETLPARTAESDALEPGSVAPRIQVRRLDDLLRVHASGRTGQRSHDRLFPTCSRRT